MISTEHEIVIAITIAIENLIRNDRDPVLIAESDPDLSGKTDPRWFSAKQKNQQKMTNMAVLTTNYVNPHIIVL